MSDKSEACPVCGASVVEDASQKEDTITTSNESLQGSTPSETKTKNRNKLLLIGIAFVAVIATATTTIIIFSNNNKEIQDEIKSQVAEEKLKLEQRLSEEQTESENKERNYEDEEIFQIVEEMPQFLGGEEKLMEYVAKNITYPLIARETGIQGRVFIGFVVEPDGSISNVRLLRGIGGGCDEEAVRVIKSMPRWEPGKNQGKTVRVSYQIPIFFKLQ